MGCHNRKSPDHRKPQPRVNQHATRHASPKPQQQGHGKTSGRSNRVSPVWYVIFLAALAASALAMLPH